MGRGEVGGEGRRPPTPCQSPPKPLSLALRASRATFTFHHDAAYTRAGPAGAPGGAAARRSTRRCSRGPASSTAVGGRAGAPGPGPGGISVMSSTSWKEGEGGKMGGNGVRTIGGAPPSPVPCWLSVALPSLSLLTTSTTAPVSSCRWRVTEPSDSNNTFQAGDSESRGVPGHSAAASVPCGWGVRASGRTPAPTPKTHHPTQPLSFPSLQARLPQVGPDQGVPVRRNGRRGTRVCATARRGPRGLHRAGARGRAIGEGMVYQDVPEWQRTTDRQGRSGRGRWRPIHAPPSHGPGPTVRRQQRPSQAPTARPRHRGAPAGGEDGGGVGIHGCHTLLALPTP